MLPLTQDNRENREGWFLGYFTSALLYSLFKATDLWGAISIYPNWKWKRGKVRTQICDRRLVASQRQ